MKDIQEKNASRVMCPLSMSSDEPITCYGLTCMAWLETRPGYGICQMVHFAPFVEVTAEKCCGKCEHGE